MPSPMDIISGKLVSQALTPSSPGRAFTPSSSPSPATRGRMSFGEDPTPPAPQVPDLFGRPTLGPVYQSPDPATPPPPAPPAPPPTGPSQATVNQALLLQGLLGGLEQTGMNPLFNAFGVQGGVSAGPYTYTGGGLPQGPFVGAVQGPSTWGGGQFWQGSSPVFPMSGWNQGQGGWGNTGVGWNPWLYGGSNPHWSQYQAQQQAWGTPWNQAMQTVLGNLAPELQALTPIQALFGSPFAAQQNTPTGWWTPTTGGTGLGVNDPLVNAAINALAQYALNAGV